MQWYEDMGGGSRSPQEACAHINELEMRAGFLALQSFVKTTNIHVRVYVDNNTSAMNCLNKMGSSNTERLNTLTKEKWGRCTSRQIWLAAARIAGKENTEAYRQRYLDSEWKLEPSNLTAALDMPKSNPSINFFASKLNYQIDRYVSFHPDPDTVIIDSFTLDWHDFECLAFPPFSLLTRVIQKSSTIQGGPGL